MKEEKNRKDDKKFILLLIICTIIVTVMIMCGIYFLFLKKDNKPVDNTKPNDQVVDNIEKDNVVEEEKKYTKESFTEFINKFKQSSDVKSVDYSYSEKKGAYFRFGEVDISDSGQVVIKSDTDGTIILSNVSNAKCVEVFNTEAALYIITNDGEVYEYSPIEYPDKERAVKIPEINNAVKFASTIVYFNNALGGNSYIGVIDKDNYYYDLWGDAA